LPELPEVETVVRTLRPCIVGRRILNAEFGQSRVMRGLPEDAAQSLAGQRIESIARHGKFIAIHLERGCLVVHLGMTGKLLVNAERSKWTHAVFTLDEGSMLYEDPRQFGRIEYGAALPERVAALGPEPLEVTLEEFGRRLKQRRSPIKAVLLNQAVVRGVGNIYADESLFRAGISPKRIAASLGPARVAKLWESMRTVLAEAIAGGGSSVSDYVDANGCQGSYQQSHNVYQRTDEACVVCGATIKRIVLAQRSTHYCGHCQR
jgi:formamidopyrimidine-DNA glycosylase